MTFPERLIVASYTCGCQELRSVGVTSGINIGRCLAALEGCTEKTLSGGCLARRAELDHAPRERTVNR